MVDHLFTLTQSFRDISDFFQPRCFLSIQPVHLYLFVRRQVNDHDFRSDADARAVPYGIYDVQANLGTVFVSTSHDTPGFAVDCVETWWRTEGCQRYAEARHLTILADGGGSKSFSWTQ